MIKSILFLCVYMAQMRIFSCEGPVRGIPSQRAMFYNPAKDFTCLDGSITLPFDYVNDDYCDCHDGTDEPGTSACPNGLFYCTNKGFIPKNIPSGFVNDGFCDCCDASDEYTTNNCTNSCDELGLEAKRLAEKLSQVATEGSRIRAQMISAAKKVLESKQKRVAELETEKTEANRLKDEAELVKKDAEAQESVALEEYKAKEDAERAKKAQEEQLEDTKEAQSYFDSFDTNKDEMLILNELKSHKIFDQNMDGEVSNEELKYIEDYSTEPLTFETFKEIVWPRIKPVIVMNKIKAEVPQAPEQGSPPDMTSSLDYGNTQNINEFQKPVDNAEDEEVEYGEEEEEDQEEHEHDPSKDFIESPEPKYDEKTAKLVEAANEARSHFEKSSRVVQDVEREMSNLKNFLSKDYGEDDEFVPLDGQCFTYTDREYSYKLCPFDQVTQMGKSGGSETRLGTWYGWGENSYIVMLYDKGQSCWNGPQRSTKVMVGCGLENEVVSATEPNKCEYVLEFKTPAACRSDDKHRDAHEEL